jgi:GR25 family glycosyltransferase involved in LPS biosynthesis
MISSTLDLDKYRNDFARINLWPKMKLGALGLLLGTVKIFELALEKDLDYLLVFEDDFIIGDNFYNKLTAAMQEKEDFDVIALGYHINPEQAQDPNIPKELIIPIEMHKPWLAKAYSYVISKKAIKKFLSYYYSNEVFPVDTMLFDKLPKLKIHDSYCINPHLISLGDVNNVDSYGHTILKLSSISRTQTIESIKT